MRLVCTIPIHLKLAWAKGVFQSFRMQRGDGDLSRCLLRCLVFIFGICAIEGFSTSSPTGISPHPSNQMISAAPPHYVSSRSIHGPSPLTLPIDRLGLSPVAPPSKSPFIKVTAPSLQPISSPPMAVSPQIESDAPDIPRKRGPVPISPSILPLSPKAFAPIIHASSPFMPSSPPTPDAKEHKSPDLRLSPSTVNPPTHIGSGTPMDQTRRKPPNGSPSTLPLVAAPPSISFPGHNDGKSGGIPASAPFSVSPSPRPSASLHPPLPTPGDKRIHAFHPVVSPAPLHHLPPSFRNKGRSYPPFYVNGPAISPAPVNRPPIEVPKNERRHVSPPNVEGPEINVPHSQPPLPAFNNKKRPSAPSQAPLHPPVEIPKRPFFPPYQAPISSPSGEKSAAPSPSPIIPQWDDKWPIYHPAPSPSYFGGKSPPPLLPPIRSLPPPPPNLYCGPIMCQEPFANSLSGSPCSCVLPIKVGLRLGVALYTFFPLVSELAQEIALGIFVKQSQVRIMGANAASEDSEKTVVLIDLVPVGRYFDNSTVFLAYEKFWHKQVAVKASYFGDYEVLYVFYPGLPPSPPTAPSYINVEGGAYGSNNNGGEIRPLGVDVRKPKAKLKLNGSVIAIIVLSSAIFLVLVVGAAWFSLKHRAHSDLTLRSSQNLRTFVKLSASRAVPMTARSKPNSTSASFSSSIATYAGSAKTFSLVEIEKMTNKFDDLRIIGEGGFGRVYEGTLEDGMRVAVKVLKRDDRQGEREFLAEVEMLGRLHHRNLVKLMGICAEENTRCLVYELVPNGSLESHLHGVDKDASPLDWNARMKIALGSARCLAYLHEDSSPPVIHRDFKSSNILLEHDYTPKVSDFGLARAALDEQNEHISTRVMGTFGYVAPEYAMTGHLLVKSDVYSYGVVLLELLTGRKPIDLLQPSGQENLVSWARPFLTNAEKLMKIIDPNLGVNYPRDSIAKVAAIASMCVEPEVSHRPFMGEVVQALKLVCNESDDFRHSESYSNNESSLKDVDTIISISSCEGPERGISQSDGMFASAGYVEDASGLIRVHSSSGPIRTGQNRRFWRRIRELASGSASEDRFLHIFRSRSAHGERWS